MIIVVPEPSEYIVALGFMNMPEIWIKSVLVGKNVRKWVITKNQALPHLSYMNSDTGVFSDIASDMKSHAFDNVYDANEAFKYFHKQKQIV